MPRIVSVTVTPVRVSPAAAELLVRVELDGPATGVEVRGRLVGPRQEGVSTVEVAYPLRVAEVSDTTVSLRGVIPEPNPSPFRYDGWVEVGAEPAAFTVVLRG